jgi:hypothetical protein
MVCHENNLIENALIELARKVTEDTPKVEVQEDTNIFEGFNRVLFNDTKFQNYYSGRYGCSLLQDLNAISLMQKAIPCSARKSLGDLTLELKQAIQAFVDSTKVSSTKAPSICVLHGENEFAEATAANITAWADEIKKLDQEIEQYLCRIARAKHRKTLFEQSYTTAARKIQEMALQNQNNQCSPCGAEGECTTGIIKDNEIQNFLAANLAITKPSNVTKPPPSTCKTDKQKVVVLRKKRKGKAKVAKKKDLAQRMQEVLKGSGKAPRRNSD